MVFAARGLRLSLFEGLLSRGFSASVSCCILILVVLQRTQWNISFLAYGRSKDQCATTAPVESSLHPWCDSKWDLRRGAVAALHRNETPKNSPEPRRGRMFVVLRPLCINPVGVECPAQSAISLLRSSEAQWGICMNIAPSGVARRTARSSFEVP